MGMVSIVSDLSFTSYTILFQRIESFSLNNSLLHNSHVPFHVFIYFDTQSEWNLSVNHTIPPLSSIELLKLNPASAMFSFSSSRSVVAIELRNSYSYITLTFPLSLCPGNLFLFKNPISVNSLSPRISAAMVLSNMACTCGAKLTRALSKRPRVLEMPYERISTSLHANRTYDTLCYIALCTHYRPMCAYDI